MSILTTFRSGLKYKLLLLMITLTNCEKDIAASEEKDIVLKRAISEASPTFNYQYYILPNDSDLESIPQDVRNKLTPDKVSLGALLFYETGFALSSKKNSGKDTYSCSSCHIPEVGFRANQPQGIADGGLGYGSNGNRRVRSQDYDEDELDAQSARPLSLVNVAYVTNTFWNGSFEGDGANQETVDIWDLQEDTERNRLGYDCIETVNFEGLFTHRIRIDSVSVSELGYKEAFDNVFVDFQDVERYSNFTGSLALSAYIRTIISTEAPFQYWLNGQYDAMTSDMKDGALLFFGKAKCFSCHYEQNLGSQEFHALGARDMYQRPSFNTSQSDARNSGRGGFTRLEEDNFKFKVPGLYNVGDSPFYFHGACKNTLDDVIDYKLKAISENSKVAQEDISSKFLPRTLTLREKEQLIMFIKEGLRDPDLLRFKPTKVVSGSCFPNADELSIYVLGCN
jgi:cytochrome c peroxidase